MPTESIPSSFEYRSEYDAKERKKDSEKNTSPPHGNNNNNSRDSSFNNNNNTITSVTMDKEEKARIVLPRQPIRRLPSSTTVKTTTASAPAAPSPTSTTTTTTTPPPPANKKKIYNKPKGIPVPDKAPLKQQLSIDPKRMYILQADGGCRGNPALSAGAGMVILDSETRKEVWCGYKFLFRGGGRTTTTTSSSNSNSKAPPHPTATTAMIKKQAKIMKQQQQQQQKSQIIDEEDIRMMTNNQAEYWALILVLEQATRMGIRHCRVECDSDLVVKQVWGRYAVNSVTLKPLCERARTLSSDFYFDSFQLVHIRRHLNERADFLANHAMDFECDSYDATVPLEGENHDDDTDDEEQQHHLSPS